MITATRAGNQQYKRNADKTLTGKVNGKVASLGKNNRNPKDQQREFGWVLAGENTLGSAPPFTSSIGKRPIFG
jgi:hypothetical protein